MTDTPKKPRGFAALSIEERRRIAALGGAAQKPESRTFARDRQKAVEAGRIGGAAPKKQRD